MAFQKYSHMDQSLFTRFVRLGTPYVELNAQGRARPSIAKLYNWRYRQLGDLPYVQQRPEFQVGCPFEVPRIILLQQILAATVLMLQSRKAGSKLRKLQERTIVEIWQPVCLSVP